MVKELQYTITEQDFFDFQWYFITHDPVSQRTIWKVRIMMAMMILIGGTALAYVLDIFNIISVLVYFAVAAAWFFLAPYWLKRNARKSVRKTLKNAVNKDICGEKILRLNDTGAVFIGKSEQSEHAFAEFSRIVATPNHIYLFLDDISAFIVPNQVFSSTEQKDTFVQFFQESIAKAKQGQSSDNSQISSEQ